MIITCESCGTKFRVGDEKLKRPVTKVRCSKCKHVFSVRLDKEQPEEEVVVLEPSESEDLIKKDEVDDKEIVDEPLDEESVTSVPHHPSMIQAKPPRPTVARSKMFVVIVLPLFFIAIAALYYFVMKPSVSQNNSKQASGSPPVAVSQKAEAFFIENVNVGQLLVVQGEVINTSKNPVSFVALEGKLLGLDGKVVLQQRFYAGNILTKDELAQLPITQIQERLMRREGDNLSNVHIKPGEKVPFMVVFYNLPPIEELTDYAVSYVNAEVEKPYVQGRAG